MFANGESGGNKASVKSAKMNTSFTGQAQIVNLLANSVETFRFCYKYDLLAFDFAILTTTFSEGKRRTAIRFGPPTIFKTPITNLVFLRKTVFIVKDVLVVKVLYYCTRFKFMSFKQV